MRANSVCMGAVALFCLAGLVRVTGYVARVAAPVRHAHDAASSHAWAELDATLWCNRFPVRSMGPDMLVLRTGRTRAAQLRTARAVQSCLSAKMRPAPGLCVLIWRPDGHDVVTCVAEGGRWRLTDVLGRPLL